MKYRLPLALAMLLFASCESSKPEPAESTKAESSPAETAPAIVGVSAETVNELLAQHEDALAAYREAMKKATSRSEQREVRKELFPNSDDYLEDLKSFADANPDHPVAVKALAWIVVNVRQNDVTKAAKDQLFDKHVNSEVMKEVCQTLMREPPSKLLEKRYQQLIDQSPHRDVKGIATYSYATYLSRMPDMVELADNPRIAKRLGQEGVDYLKNFKFDESKVESLYVSVVNDYSDVIGSRNEELGERAERGLFALRNLSIGKVAPDIEGQDLDGESFKLSDYRGKVVMIDFWGDW